MATRYRPIPLPDRSDLSDEARLAVSEAVPRRMRARHTVREFSDRAVDRRVIERCIAATATAPSGANQQPWRFVLIGQGPLRSRLRTAAETEERAFYAGRAGREWLEVLGALGTHADKPFLETARWLIAIFGQRHGLDAQGRKVKHYYVP